MRIGSTSSLIACNSEIVDKCPTNPEEFWDVENFPGTRAIRNRPFEVFAFALLADGVSPDELYPLDLDRAVAKLEEIKPHIKVWPAGVTQELQIITSGEVGVIFTASGIAYRAKRRSVPGLEAYWNGSVKTA